MLAILTYEEFEQQLSEFLDVDIEKCGWGLKTFMLEGIKFEISFDYASESNLDEHVAIIHDLKNKDDPGLCDVICRLPTYYGHILNAALKGEDILRLDTYKGGNLVVVDIDQVAKNLYDYLREKGGVVQNIKNAS